MPHRSFFSWLILLGSSGTLVWLSGCETTTSPPREVLVAQVAGQGGTTRASTQRAPASRDPAKPFQGAWARTDPAFRAPGPRGSQTIFSRPDYSAPTETRLGSGAPGPGYWQQRVDYQIDAALAAEAEVLTARGTITYTNNSPHELPFLWLHLEQNLFKKGSTGDLMTPAGARFDGPENFDGGFEITAIRVAPLSSAGSSMGLTPGMALPLAIYDTIGRIDLPTPIPARGGRLAFEIEWSFKIPPYGADRMGIQAVEQGKIFQLAQWFPAVAAYDDTHGWNTLPYLGQGEFYTNFGDYDVTITVPRTHIVAATGELQNPEAVLSAAQLDRWRQARQSPRETVMIRDWPEIGTAIDRPEGQGPVSWHFKASDCRTFAWASSEAFIWDGRMVSGTGPVDASTGQRAGTFCQSFYPKEASPVTQTPPRLSRPGDRDDDGDRARDVDEGSVGGRIGQWGPRAPGKGSTDMLAMSIEHYSKAWFPYPYPAASNVNGVVGGMEYPMVIFCSERFDQKGLFGVTTHEIGHNWFPMLVNTDERRHAWMDEGFNTFINYYAFAERYPDEAGKRRGDAQRFVDSMRLGNQQPMEFPADQVPRLGIMQYEKPAVALVLLREVVLGPERFDAGFREYIRRWAFKSPRPEDFFRTMEDVAGGDLSWFWRGWFLESTALDQAVTKVDNASDGQATITFENRGEMVMPLTYRVTYKDGTSEIRRAPVEVWFVSNRWATTLDTQGHGAITNVELDPDGDLPDLDRSNNTWVL
jgi:Peptidase family M1 domain